MPEPVSDSSNQRPPRETTKEAAMGLIVSFVMVMVFRGFFFEPFHIPTGSMAPTLMGRHHRFQSENTGFEWAVNSWEEFWARQRQAGAGSTANPIGTANVYEPQTGADPAVISDRRAGWRLTSTNPPARAGDRIGIVKYNRLFPPRRWDVIVVKWPAVPHESYIKRLVGLPGETLLLLDGDVFVKKDAAPPTKSAGEAPLTDEGWSIERKPARVQRAVWWPVFSSESTPLNAVREGRPWVGPWAGEGWNVGGETYESTSAAPGALRWDSEHWPVTDWAPYNDTADFWPRMSRFPVSDVRLRAGVESIGAGLIAKATIEAHGCEFSASIEGEVATLEMRAPPLAQAGAPESSTDAKGREVIFRRTAKVRALKPGRVADVEFWHADQRITLWIDGEKVLEASYDWGPMERLRRAVRPGVDADLLVRTPGMGTGNPLADARIYRNVGASWEMTGAPARFHRVGLDRDLHYQASSYRYSRRLSNGPALATHPSNMPTLSPDEFFLCGDNSANSADSRLVDEIEPWVEHRIDPKLGVIHRRLVAGKAVMVFFPAPQPLRLGSTWYSFIPDFGRMRWIR